MCAQALVNGEEQDMRNIPESQRGVKAAKCFAIVTSDEFTRAVMA